jgi:hypothetical protein
MSHAERIPPPAPRPDLIVFHVERHGRRLRVEVPGKHYEAVPKTLPAVMLGMLDGGTVRLKECKA